MQTLQLASEDEKFSQNVEISTKIKIPPEKLAQAIEIFKLITSKLEYKDLESGLHYSFLINKGEDKGHFKIKSLLMHPSEENKKRLSNLIKEIHYSVLKVIGEEPIERIIAVLRVDEAPTTSQ